MILMIFLISCLENTFDFKCDQVSEDEYLELIDIDGFSIIAGTSDESTTKVGVSRFIVAIG